MQTIELNTIDEAINEFQTFGVPFENRWELNDKFSCFDRTYSQMSPAALQSLFHRRRKIASVVLMKNNQKAKVTCLSIKQLKMLQSKIACHDDVKIKDIIVTNLHDTRHYLCGNGQSFEDQMSELTLGMDYHASDWEPRMNDYDPVGTIHHLKGTTLQVVIPDTTDLFI